MREFRNSKTITRRYIEHPCHSNLETRPIAEQNITRDFTLNLKNHKVFVRIFHTKNINPVRFCIKPYNVKIQ